MRCNNLRKYVVFSTHLFGFRDGNTMSFLKHDKWLNGELYDVPYIPRPFLFSNFSHKITHEFYEVWLSLSSVCALDSRITPLYCVFCLLLSYRENIHWWFDIKLAPEEPWKKHERGDPLERMTKALSGGSDSSLDMICVQAKRHLSRIVKDVDEDVEEDESAEDALTTTTWI